MREQEHFNVITLESDIQIVQSIAFHQRLQG